MGSTPLRLTLRQKPHLDYVIGYPGLVTEPPLQQASLEGTIEVRVPTAVHTEWLKVELKKTETVQTKQGVRRYFELIGSKEQTLWSGGNSKDSDSENFAPLETGDFPFAIPLPPGLPPSISLDKSKNTGIAYHLVATARIKLRSKGLFGGTSNNFKSPTLVTQIAEVAIEKHELNPAWPIYTWQAESNPVEANHANVTLRLKRDTVIYGSGDPVNLGIEIRSNRSAPIKITRIEFQLRQTTCTREPDGRGASTDPKKRLQTVVDVISSKTASHSLLYQEESMSHTIASAFPQNHPHFTVQNAKHLDVKYTIRVRAVIEVPKEAKAKKDVAKAKEEPIKDIVLDDVPVIVSPWSKKHGEWWRNKVGQTPRNLQRPMPSESQQQSVMKPVAGPSSPIAPRIDGQRDANHFLPSTASQNSSPAGVAARAFSQRVQQGNQASASSTSLPSQSQSPSQGQSVNQLRPEAPNVSPGVPVEQPPARRSVEEERAAAIEKGRRLSSWPPPPKETTEGQRTPQKSASAANGAAVPSSFPPSTQGPHVQSQYRQTQSDIEHGATYWQPTRDVASLDGHTAAFRNSFHETDPSRAGFTQPSYDVSQSYSQPQHLGGLGHGSPPQATQNHHRRVMSDGQQMQVGADQREEENQKDLPGIPYEGRRASMPLQATNITMGNARRTSLTERHGQPFQHRRMHVDTTAGGYPTRKNTLSTIEGSLPSSQQSSPLNETASAPMPQREWESAEQEKQRLSDEAFERAQRTQDDSGNPASQYRSVENRTPTPLNLMRTVSNPSPSHGSNGAMRSTDRLLAPRPNHSNRFSIASTHLGYMASDRDDGQSLGSREPTPTRSEYPHSVSPSHDHSSGQQHSSHVDGLSGSSEGLEPLQSSLGHSSQEHSTRNKPGIPDGLNSSNTSYIQSPLSASTSNGQSLPNLANIDPQKLAYLRALAAREAYQRRVAGQDVEPLSALEEKHRLQRLYNREEERASRGEEAWHQSSDVDHGIANGKHAASDYHEDSVDNRNWSQNRDEGPSTPYSVYLTPDTSAGNRFQADGRENHNPYFGTPQSSSAQLAMSTSDPAPTDMRNLDISSSKGKQKRVSMYTDESGHDLETLDHQNTYSAPPPRPPKGRDVVSDSYRHLDTPVSPGAAEYERHFRFGRSSQSSHYGH